MAARLILNADDFGLTCGINRAIAELHQAGALTSATLMAAGPAFDDAVSLARTNPTLGVGCHIVLTDGTPVSDANTLPTLCPNGRSFRPSLLHFVRDLLRGRIDSVEVEREALAQINKLQRAGIRVTHLDTHKHTHLFAPVARAVAHAATQAGVSILRNPFEPDFARHAAEAPLKRRLQIALLDRFGPAFRKVAQDLLRTDGTVGISATGSLNAQTLHATLNAIPDAGAYELLCHPGYNDADLDAVTTRLRQHREVEYQALLTQIPALCLQPNPPQLIHYGEL